jgi:Fe-S-cluster-containing hydrogenase component 2
VATIHPEAPAKPAFGTPCNGCGLCCLAEPCPVGMLVSRKRSGACSALRWVAGESASAVDRSSGAPGTYRCGLIAAPQEQLPIGLQRRAPALSRALATVLRRMARRFISAGSGCDADLLVETAQPSRRAPG